MVIYNPKEWWRLIFAFHRSDTFRTLIPGIIGLAMYTGVICYLENDFFGVSFKNTTVVHSLIGFVLSLLLVFRTNTAYDRWWEGRKAWGSFVNNSRNLMLKISALSMDHHDKVILRDLIKNYVYSTKEHLRDGVDINQLIEAGPYTLDYYRDANHVPNRVMKAVYSEINKHYSNGVIDGYTLMFINTELQSFTDVVGICERIRKTPIPYSYNIFLKKVIFIYIFSMPIGFVREFGYWSMVIVPMVFYIFAGLEVLAEEIEDPFGTDDNDLPTDQMSATIASNLDEIVLNKS